MLQIDRKDSPRVLVKHEVATFLDEMARGSTGVPESGGIFIGRYRGPHIEIVGHTSPGPGDVSTLHSFVKQDHSHQDRALTAWETSNGTDTDVGEWHTHPIGDPSPSGVDLGTWKRLVRANRRPMAFVVAASSKWALFLVTPGMFFTNHRPLKLLEGGNGRVFG